MKIAIFSDTFYPMIDGVVTSTVNLSTELANMGNEVIIISAGEKYERSILAKNIEVIKFKGFSLPNYKAYKITIPHGKVIRLLKEFKEKQGFEPDVIIVDYLELMKPNHKNKTGQKHEELRTVAEELRDIGLENDIPIISATTLPSLDNSAKAAVFLLAPPTPPTSFGFPIPLYYQTNATRVRSHVNMNSKEIIFSQKNYLVTGHS